MRNKVGFVLLTTTLLMVAAGMALAQRDQQTRSGLVNGSEALKTQGLISSYPIYETSSRILVVEGHNGHAEVIHKEGRTYVDLQSLTEITNGSLSFKGSQIVLSLPASNMSRPPVAETPAEPTHRPADASGLSQDFMRAGIEEFATLREWASTMAYAIQNNYHITEDWAANYREQAANKLRLASAAAATEGDRNALQLLSNEFRCRGRMEQ